MAPSPSVVESAIGARQETFGPPEAAAAGRGGFYYIYLSIFYFCATLALLVGVTLMSENITQLQSTFYIISDNISMFTISTWARCLPTRTTAVAAAAATSTQLLLHNTTVSCTMYYIPGLLHPPPPRCVKP